MSKIIFERHGSYKYKLFGSSSSSTSSSNKDSELDHLLLMSILYCHPHLKNGASVFSQSHYMTIFCNEIQTLDDCLRSRTNDDNTKKMEMAGQLICSLANQQRYLEKHGYSFSHFRLSDILVIDHSIFVCIGLAGICPILKERITLYRPLVLQEVDPLFLSTELKQMKELPFKVNYKTFYSSLGSLVLFVYFAGIQEYNEDIVRPIYGTMLYWFLFHSMNPDVERRRLFYF